MQIALITPKMEMPNHDLSEKHLEKALELQPQDPLSLYFLVRGFFILFQGSLATHAAVRKL